MRKVLALLGAAFLSSALLAQTSPPAASGYLVPPKAIVEVLDAPPPPTVELSASGSAMAVLERASMPSIAELSQPMLRLAGLRINPRTNGLHRAVRYRHLTIKAGRWRRAQGVAAAQSRDWMGEVLAGTARGSRSRRRVTQESSCGSATRRPAQPGC